MAGHGAHAGGGPAQFPQVFKARLEMNHTAMIYFAACLAGLAGAFIIYRFTRILARKTRVTVKAPALTGPFTIVSRILRRHLVHKAPLLPSAGHVWLGVVYVAINILLTFSPLLNHAILSLQSNVASRTGWLATANICLAIFFGLKNTPLAYLTSWSYERLNVLHKFVGYTAMAHTVIHGVAYAAYFIQQGNMARLRVHEEIYGTVAGFTMLVLVLVGVTLRRRYYELFYIIHVSFFIMTMVFVGLHQPETNKRIVFAVVVGTGVWSLDRLIRLMRLVLFSLNNAATVHPLPNGGTRITLRKAPFGARSGQHCFLWIPSVRSFEMHPFTIAAADPLEFVIASYDGFTRDLHSFAKCHPGAALKASVKGSYGTTPNPADYDNLVFVAGGSGASFTVGMALNLLKGVMAGSQHNITFVWTVRDYVQLEWFAAHLDTIRHNLQARVLLFVTGPSRPNSMDRPMEPIADLADPSDRVDEVADIEKTSDYDKETGIQPPAQAMTRSFTGSEKSFMVMDPTSPVSTCLKTRSHNSSIRRRVQATRFQGTLVNYCRADVSGIIRDAVEATPSDKRILVMGCGPDSLMTEVRNTTAKSIKTNGPSVELHCEQFGW